MPIRPATVSMPLRIHQIKLDRVALDRMPEDARCNLFLFGHVSNEINTLIPNTAKTWYARLLKVMGTEMSMGYVGPIAFNTWVRWVRSLDRTIRLNIEGYENWITNG